MGSSLRISEFPAACQLPMEHGQPHLDFAAFFPIQPQNILASAISELQNALSLSLYINVLEPHGSSS